MTKVVSENSSFMLRSGDHIEESSDETLSFEFSIAKRWRKGLQIAKASSPNSSTRTVGSCVGGFLDFQHDSVLNLFLALSRLALRGR